MTRKKPTVVSLFAGCGGSSLGYKQAGCKVRLAVEFNKHAVETYRTNFPKTPIFADDVKDLSVDQALKLAKLEPGELDILDGSPPCQGFSMAGDRNFEDTRNDLFQEYIRLLTGLKPKALVMENVRGLVVGKMRFVFAEMLRAMKGAGYRIRVQLLNAAWYGTPQWRRRIIFIGARDDLGIDPTHPKPTVEHEVTVREALRDCPGDTKSQIDKYGELRELQDNVALVAPKLRGGASRLGKHKDKNGIYADSMSTYMGFGYVHQRLNGQRPAMTITAMGSDTGYGTKAIHPDENRALSIPEIQRLCGFPDDFVMEGTYKNRHARFGNCVPPPLAKAIAEHVVKTIIEPGCNARA